MEEDMKTEDERVNEDRLEFYMQEKIPVHIILKREARPGVKIFLRGLIVSRPTDRIWVIDEVKLKEVRVSILEIAPEGVHELRGRGE